MQQVIQFSHQDSYMDHEGILQQEIK
jgi:hypothetical protein